MDRACRYALCKTLLVHMTYRYTFLCIWTLKCTWRECQDGILLKADVCQHVCSKDTTGNRIIKYLVFKLKSINNFKHSVDHQTCQNMHTLLPVYKVMFYNTTIFQPQIEYNHLKVFKAHVPKW